MNDPRQSPLRVGLLGCGRLAEFGYVPAFDLAAGIELGGLADKNIARCRAIAPSLPAHDSLEALLDSGGIEALIIATPTRCHVGDARRAAQAGLPVLLEKPPAPNLDEARRLLGLEPLPWMAFNRRHDPELARVRAERRPGEPFELLVELLYRRSGWKPFDMHDDALLDLGPHLIDLARWLAGSEILSVETRLLSERRAEFSLQFAGGSVCGRCACDRPYREKVQLRDGEGRLLGGFERGGLVAGILGKLQPGRKNPLVDSLVNQLEAFARTVQGLPVRENLATVSDGIIAMATIDALRESARAGRAIRPTTEFVGP